MTRIRAKCPACGDVEFGIDAIVVVVGATGANAHDGDDHAEDRAYRFSCPRCATSVRRPAVADVIELLITAGVRVESATATLTDTSRPSPERYPTLTDADVDAFRELLAGPDWFDQLKAYGD